MLKLDHGLSLFNLTCNEFRINIVESTQRERENIYFVKCQKFVWLVYLHLFHKYHFNTSLNSDSEVILIMILKSFAASVQCSINYSLQSVWWSQPHIETNKYYLFQNSIEQLQSCSQWMYTRSEHYGGVVYISHLLMPNTAFHLTVISNISFKFIIKWHLIDNSQILIPSTF